MTHNIYRKFSRALRAVAALAILSAALTAPLTVQAAEQAEDPAAAMAGLIYDTLGPSFISNYDGAGRLKYLRADVAVRIEPGTAAMLDAHLPYLRNKLVVLFGAQLEENLTSTQGKETLRLQALDEVKAALDFLVSSGTGDRVKNLYFTSFVVQR